MAAGSGEKAMKLFELEPTVQSTILTLAMDYVKIVRDRLDKCGKQSTGERTWLSVNFSLFVLTILVCTILAHHNLWIV